MPKTHQNVYKMVKNMNDNSSVQLSLFHQEGTSVKDNQSANSIGKLSTYLNTRGGLFRLLSLFPGNMPVAEAVRLAPTVLTKERKEVAL